MDKIVGKKCLLPVALLIQDEMLIDNILARKLPVKMTWEDKRSADFVGGQSGSLIIE